MFQKLHKAARDYRQQQGAVVVPLLRLKKQPRQKPWLLIMGVGLVLVISGSIFGSIYYLVGPIKKTEAPAVTVAEQDNDAASGIVLRAEKLLPPVEENVGLTEVTQQIEKMPVLAPAPLRKKETAEIIVHDVGEAPSTRWLYEARRLFAAGNTQAAIGYYNKILARDPANDVVITELAYLLQKEATPGALQVLQNLAQSHPANANLQVALAQSYSQRGENQMALAAWQRAVQLEPTNGNYRLSLAIIYDRLGQGSSALALYRQVPAPVPAAIQQRISYLSAMALR